MDELEDLVQRFIDNELSPAERLEFLKLLDQDAGVRQRVLELELVVAEANQMPRRMSHRRFTAQVLAKLPPARLDLRQRFREFFWAPRELQWNLASAIVAACAVVLLTVVVTRVSVRTLPPAPTVAGKPADQPVLVRLVILQPQARSVAVAGDFNGWNPSRTLLQRAEGGMWTVTIPLKPGHYEYMFVVDGKHWIADPLAAEDSVDGFGSRNAVLDVEATI